MFDNSKRYKKKRSDDPPGVGNYVNWHIQQNKIKKSSVSKFLDVNPTTLNQYFKQTSLQFSILWRISLAVKHNLVMELGERLNIPFETKSEKELKNQLLEKEKEIETLKLQIEFYKEIMGAK